MLESEKRHLPDGGNGLQFKNTHPIAQKPRENKALKLDAVSMYQAIQNRERTNQLLGQWP